MSGLPPVPFRPVVDPGSAALLVRVCGDLDDAAGSELVDAVRAHLSRTPRPRDVRLDFRALTGIDPLGLAALLMVRRHTSAAGATLHLDNRPAALERMLHHTNVLEHLTAAVEAAPARTGPDARATGGAAGPD
ncbi:STAS domain-containing protein [Streptomyces viridosporus]|uniref:STAS domain-containing protein n=1 Tax=Streptomyces viridosporus TaxID=67581 RepID=UPI00370298C8